MSADRGLSNVVFGQSPYEEMNWLYSFAHSSIATLRKIEVAKSMRLSKAFPSLSCGVSVIYAGLGESGELGGGVVEPEEPALLAQATCNLASDPAMRNELGRTGRVFVEREYNWSTIVRRWLRKMGASAKGETVPASTAATRTT